MKCFSISHAFRALPGSKVTRSVFLDWLQLSIDSCRSKPGLSSKLEYSTSSRSGLGRRDLFEHLKIPCFAPECFRRQGIIRKHRASPHIPHFTLQPHGHYHSRKCSHHFLTTVQRAIGMFIVIGMFMNIWRPFQLAMRWNKETSAFVCGIYPAAAHSTP